VTKAPKKLDELFHDTLKDIYFAEKKILSLTLGRRQEAGAVQPVEDRSGKAVAGRPVASVA